MRVSVLEIDHLNKTYGTLRALRDLTFDVRAGEIFGFVGSNGAGKTTAMRIMLGVLAADSGQVRWRGAQLDLDARRRVGYMPEERGLYPKMKVGAQLRYLAGLHGLSPAAADRAVDLWTDRLGVGARRGDDVEKLSLGNQQRVQLAAALVHDPEILVLDEPFSGLDPVAVDVMSQVLRERAGAGVPVIFSSHQLDLVERLCDRVGIVRSGQMEALGTIDELRRTARPQWRLDVAVPGADAGALRRAVDAEPGLRVVAEPTTPGAAAAGRSAVVVEAVGDTHGAEQRLLAAALRLGAVHEFAPVRPSLTDLFRDVVSSEAAPESDAGAGIAQDGDGDGSARRRRGSLVGRRAS